MIRFEVYRSRENVTYDQIEQQVLDLLQRYSRAAIHDGDQQLLESLREGAQEHADPKLSSRTWLATAVMYMIEGEREKAFDACAQGLEFVQGTDTDHEVDLLVLQGRLLLANDARAALEVLTRAHDMSTRIHGAPQIHTRLRLADALAALGDTTKAIELIRWCEQQYEIAGNVDGRSTVLRRLCSVMLNAGHHAPVIEYATEAIRISEDRPYARVEAYKFLAMALTKAKSYMEAFEVARQALDQSKNVSTKHTRADCLGILGDIYLAINDLPQALSTYAEALEVYTKLGFDNGVVMCLKSIGETYTRSGDAKEAITVMNNALDIANTINNSALINAIVDALSAVHAEIGETSEAERVALLRREITLDAESEKASKKSINKALSVFRSAKSQQSSPLPTFADLQKVSATPVRTRLQWLRSARNNAHRRLPQPVSKFSCWGASPYHETAY